MNATQINFISTGEYTNQFDEFGNLTIVEGSNKYLSVILNPEVYQQQSLSAVYNIDIEEFKEVSVVPNKKVASLESEKTNLQQQISDLTAHLQSINPSEKDTLINASKNIIVSLRIKAGEGSISSDFNNAFPYLSLTAPINSSPTQASTSLSPSNGTQSTTDTLTSSTKKIGTSVTQTLAAGDICPVQQDLQIIPPTDFIIKGPVPVFPHPIQQDVQIIPPIDFITPPPVAVFTNPVPIITPPPVAVFTNPVPIITPPPVAVFTNPVTITTQPRVPIFTKPVTIITPPRVQLPIHQIAVAVAAVTPRRTSCKELFYKYGKYKGVWESRGRETSPMINTYGVHSENISETFDHETSDTLPYQVYIPTDGSYTIKFSADNSGYIDMDDVKLIDLSNINSSSPYNSQLDAYMGDHATTTTLTSGWKKVNLFYKNWGGPHSVAASIVYNGRVVWHSRMAYNAHDYQECIGDLIMRSPVAQPVVPLVAQPVVPSIAQPVVPLVAQPVVPSIVQLIAESVTPPVAQSVAQPVAQLIAQLVTQPVAQSVSRKEGCDNPISTKVYSFASRVLSLTITIHNNTVTYSNENSRRDTSRNAMPASVFHNGGLDKVNPTLTVLSSTRAQIAALQGNNGKFYNLRTQEVRITIRQQPSVKNDYTTIIDIFNQTGNNGNHYDGTLEYVAFELYQLKCDDLDAVLLKNEKVESAARIVNQKIKHSWDNLGIVDINRARMNKGLPPF